MSEDDIPSDEVVIVYELTPTPEQRALADFLKLPSTFFCYKNKPGYVSDEDDGKECQNLYLHCLFVGKGCNILDWCSPTLSAVCSFV